MKILGSVVAAIGALAAIGAYAAWAAGSSVEPWFKALVGAVCALILVMIGAASWAAERSRRDIGKVLREAEGVRHEVKGVREDVRNHLFTAIRDGNTETHALLREIVGHLKGIDGKLEGWMLAQQGSRPPS